VTTSLSRRVLVVYVALVFAFLLAPLLIVIVFSFSDDSAFAFPPTAFSLRWFRYLRGRDEFITSAFVSVQIALIASIGAVVLGLLASMALVRYQFRGRQTIETALMSPLALPGIITGVALLQFFSLAGLMDSFTRLVLAHIVICTPYAIRSISASLHGIDPTLEEASRVTGADSWTTFRRVVLPLLHPGLLAAFIFSFITSFDNVVVSIYLIGADTVTLPIRILTYLEWQFDPSIAAISTILILITTVLVAVAEAIGGISGAVRSSRAA
jgi:putative spermidine/putrescine transport system permease protein